MRKIDHFFSRVALLLLCSLFIMPGHAQQSSDEASTETEQVEKPASEKSDEQKKRELEEKAAAERQKQAAEAKRNKRSGKKVFKPTEEISEDSPVPFPVDI